MKHFFMIMTVLVFSLTTIISAQEYEVIDLGTLGGTISRANAINENGIIAGWATALSSGHPVLWMNNTIIQVLDNPPGYAGEAVAVNNLGQVAVTGETNPQSYKAFLWENNTYTDLGVLPGRNESVAEDIDDMGRIIGRSFTLGSGTSSYIWEDGVMTDLGTLGGSTDAFAINKLGQVVGWTQAEQPGGTQEIRAFIWENNVMAALDPLPNEDYSQAFGINDSGDVVGSSWHVTIPQFLSADQSTLWQNGSNEIVDLGLTPGPPVCVDQFPFYTKNIARAINNHGQIVGHAQCIASGAAKAAFLWENGVMYNLNDLIPPESGWDLLRANDINDDGKIVGFGISPSGELHGFLLIPATVPVELNSFKATVEGNTVTLLWNTATETNNNGFEIHRQMFSGAYEKIGWVNGYGTTTEITNYSFNDIDVPAGTHNYRLVQIDYNGTRHNIGDIAVEIVVSHPDEYILSQNYPNPFNPVTNIPFTIPSGGIVKMRVFNIMGEEVQTLVNGFMDVGTHKISFDAENLTSGIYYYRLEVNGFTTIKKMMLLK